MTLQRSGETGAADGKTVPAGTATRAPVDSEVRHRNIGRLLIEAFDRFEARIVEGVRRRGFTDFSLSDTAVLRNLDLEGTRISDIARRARMTPQGAGQIVQGLESRGYVERRTDPSDGRARLVHFTDAGWALIAAGQEVNRRLDEEWSALLGAEGLATLRKLLGQLVRGIGPDGRLAAERDAGEGQGNGEAAGP